MSPASASTAEGNGRETLDATAVRARLLQSFSVLFVGVMAVAGLPGLLSDVNGWLVLLWAAALALTLAVGMAMAVRHILGPIEGVAEIGERLRGADHAALHDPLVDPLTGLGNHRAFQEELVRQVAAAREHGHPLTLALIDLDDLKRTNDEQGHAAGDRLLAAMGRLISTTTRSGDRGFRVGGDEFVILMPRHDANAAYLTMRRLLAMALGDEGAASGRPVYSFSAGISTYPDLCPDVTRLRQQADAALLWAKRHGRTDVQVFDAERHDPADDQRASPELAAAVADVAQRRALVPRYQAIFDLQTGEVVGFEGLVMPDQSSGFPDAGSLFVAAETTERTVELDLAAVEVVAAGLGDAAGERYLSINLSPRTLETAAFSVSDVVVVLARNGIDPGQVVIELTEREVIADMSRLEANLQACREAGMRIAADDVGAGNAGLRLLSHIQFDVVKIDLSLVQGGVLRDAALGVLSAISDLAARTGAILVAEGIETSEQLAVLRRLGIAAGQGYLLAEPAETPRIEGVDLELLEGLAREPEWVDPRLVLIGLAAEPGGEDHEPAVTAMTEATHPEPTPIRPAAPAKPRPAKKTRRRPSTPGEAARGVS